MNVERDDTAGGVGGRTLVRCRMYVGSEPFSGKFWKVQTAVRQDESGVRYRGDGARVARQKPFDTWSRGTFGCAVNAAARRIGESYVRARLQSEPGSPYVGSVTST